MAGPAFPPSDRARGALNPEYPVRVFYRLLGVWQTPPWPSTHVDLARPCFLCVGQHQGHYAVCGSANMANFPGLAGVAAAAHHRCSLGRLRWWARARQTRPLSAPATGQAPRPRRRSRPRTDLSCRYGPARAPKHRLRPDGAGPHVRVRHRCRISGRQHDDVDHNH